MRFFWYIYSFWELLTHQKKSCFCPSAHWAKSFQESFFFITLNLEIDVIKTKPENILYRFWSNFVWILTENILIDIFTKMPIWELSVKKWKWTQKWSISKTDPIDLVKHYPNQFVLTAYKTKLQFLCKLIKTQIQHLSGNYLAILNIQNKKKTTEKNIKNIYKKKTSLASSGWKLHHNTASAHSGLP